MLKRIKLIERFNSAYMLCAFGDLYISKVAPGWKAPWFRGKVTGQGLWAVVPRNGNMHRCQTLWAALKHADATGSFKPLERFYGSRPDLIDVDTALAEAGEHPAELAEINAAEQSGYDAFASIAGRLMDTMRGTKSQLDYPRCPLQQPRPQGRLERRLLPRRDAIPRGLTLTIGDADDRNQQQGY